MSKSFDAGIVTAYGAAVRGGYTGTYEEFCADQAQFARNASAAAASAREAADMAKTAGERAAAAETAVKAAEDARDKTDKLSASARKTQTEIKISETAVSRDAYAAREASNTAGRYAEEAQAWTAGKKNGEDVKKTDEQYHNNAKYYAELAKQYADVLGNIEERLEILETGEDMQAEKFLSYDTWLESISKDLTELKNSLTQLQALVLES